MIQHGRLQTLSDIITSYIEWIEYLLEGVDEDNVTLKSIQAIRHSRDAQKEQQLLLAEKMSIP